MAVEMRLVVEAARDSHFARAHVVAERAGVTHSNLVQDAGCPGRDASGMGRMEDRTNPLSRAELLGSGLALASAALFGTTGTARALGPDVSASAVGAARLVGGALARTLAALVLEGGASLRVAVRRPRACRWILTAAAATAVYQGAFFAAVAHAGVALGTVVAIGSAPLLTGLLSRLVTGEPLTYRWGAATMLAVIGCGLLLLPGRSGSVGAGGVALALVAGMAYATYTVSAKRLLDSGARPLPILAISLGIGAVLVVPVLAVSDLGPLARPSGVAMLPWLVLAGTVAPYVLYVRALGLVPATRVGTLALAEPLTATALGILLLGERPGLYAALGGGLVLAALVSLTIERPPE
jgi:DME family drug/metabolite transporter